MYTITSNTFVEGASTRQQGDLISREALKKALYNFFDEKIIEEPTYILRDVFCYIDNAPTVEPEITDEDIKQAIQEGYKTGYKTGYEAAKTKYERQQGEWITVPDRTYCSNCNYFEQHPLAQELMKKQNFCPNCGADMRGDKNEID